MRSSTILAAVLPLVISANLQAQSKPAQVDELRRQVEVLQKQLSRLENSESSPAHKVTQLGATRQQRGNPTLVVRVYDLSDLFTISPAYTAAIGNELGLAPRPLFPEAGAASGNAGSPTSGGMGSMGGGMGGGVFDVQHEPLLAQAANGRTAPAQAMGTDVAASAKTSMQSLINAIQSTIDPDSWEELSGPGSIARIGTSLIIRNEAGVHEQIDALFTLLRQKWGTLRTVSISAGGCR
ncbi:MAG TPA: hypothetical protein VKU82_10860 [Planctomycetaceae bacterium]|nr:hypothetical protein [Planctomycetaceae bacterium]